MTCNPKLELDETEVDPATDDPDAWDAERAAAITGDWDDYSYLDGPVDDL